MKITVLMLQKISTMIFIFAKQKDRHDVGLFVKEWAEVDSNHRSNLQQIYSLSPLATRESAHFHQNAKHSDNLEL